MILPRAHSQVKPSESGLAPSLTAQAAARVTLRALTRSDRTPGGGADAAGTRQVSPRPSAFFAAPAHFGPLGALPAASPSCLRAGPSPASPGGPA